MPRTKVTEEGIWQGGLFHRERRIEWKDMVRIVADTINRVTFDEVFIQLEGRSGTIIAIGELSREFEDIEEVLVSRFPSIPNDWRERVEREGFCVLYEATG